MNTSLKLPDAPRGIQKGVPLKLILNEAAVRQMGQNLSLSFPSFPQERFFRLASDGLDKLELMPRGLHIAHALRLTLPQKFADAVSVLLSSLTPPETHGESGTGLFFYLPYSCFLSEYGLHKEDNAGEDPFPAAMQGIYELTRRFTSEWAVRNYLLKDPQRTLSQLQEWLNDPSTDVRRLCSEGTRPLLPWGKRLPTFLEDPSHTLPLLEKLKNDPELYVRRSVANHLGDLAKKHPDFIFTLCEQWLEKEESKEMKWLIRHAVRYYAKKEHPRALQVRRRAK